MQWSHARRKIVGWWSDDRGRRSLSNDGNLITTGSLGWNKSTVDHVNKLSETKVDEV